MSKESREALAIKCLKELNIYKPYISRFKSSGPCFYERGAGYWAYQEEALQNKIAELESNNDKTVFAVIHGIYGELGEIWDILYIDDDMESIENVLDHDYTDGSYGVFSYCCDKDLNLIDMGDIGVKPFIGGIVRVW